MNYGSWAKNRMPFSYRVRRRIARWMIKRRKTSQLGTVPNALTSIRASEIVQNYSLKLQRDWTYSVIDKQWTIKKKKKLKNLHKRFKDFLHLWKLFTLLLNPICMRLLLIRLNKINLAIKRNRRLISNKMIILWWW